MPDVHCDVCHEHAPNLEGVKDGMVLTHAIILKSASDNLRYPRLAQTRCALLRSTSSAARIFDASRAFLLMTPPCGGRPCGTCAINCARRSSLTGARPLLAARATGAGRAVVGRAMLGRPGASGAAGGGSEALLCVQPAAALAAPAPGASGAAGGGSEALRCVLRLGKVSALPTGGGERGGRLRGGGLRGLGLRPWAAGAAAGSGLGLDEVGFGSRGGECPAIGGGCTGAAVRGPYTSCPATIRAAIGSAAALPPRHSRSAEAHLGLRLGLG